MPLYDYEHADTNSKCGKTDKIMSFIVPLARFDEELKCPECKKPLRRLLSAPMFKFGSL
jgi:putative FmdB family regulatory protein